MGSFGLLVPGTGWRLVGVGFGPLLICAGTEPGTTRSNEQSVPGTMGSFGLLVPGTGWGLVAYCLAYY